MAWPRCAATILDLGESLRFVLRETRIKRPVPSTAEKTKPEIYSFSEISNLRELHGGVISVR